MRIRLAFIVLALFSLLILSGCMETDAFAVWDVPREGVPNYRVVEAIETSPGVLSARLVSDGSGEVQAKQVLADFMTKHRDAYDAISARINKDADGKYWLAYYAATEEVAAKHFGDVIDMDKAREAGFPLLVFSKPNNY